MKFSLLVPYRPDPHRERLLRWVIARWYAAFPDLELCFGTTDGPFVRGEARNNAFKRATRDVLVVADADTAAQPELVAEAVEIAATNRTWVLPYTVYFNLDERTTLDLLEQPPDVELAEPDVYEHRLTESVGGIQVLHRAAWEAVGGYDTRFKAWSYEDDAFAVSLDVLWGPRRRLAGHVQHLWHPRGLDFGDPRVGDNRRLFLRYKRARSRAAMAALVDEG